MKKPRRSSLVSSLALVAALNAPALAHGGAYKGPPGEIPPNTREPSDPPPPPETGPPGTPGGDTGGGPTTPGPDVGGPGTGDGPGGGPPTGGAPTGPPPTGGPGGPGGPKTGGPRGSQAQRGLEDWTFWWHANDDALLGLRSRMRERRGAPTGSGAHALGESVGGANRVLETTRSAVNLRIVPALREILADESEDPDARSAAALGLAKIGDPQSVPELLRILRGGRKSPRIVEESAALALGLFRKESREVRETLLETVADRDRDGTFARPFAAIALGLAPVPAEERPALARSLLELLRRPETGTDAKPCILQAIGLLGETSVAADLLAIATDPKALPANARASDLERAHAVHALGRIGRDGFGDARLAAAAIDGILELTSEREPRLVRQSATVALGLVGTAAEPKARRRIVSALDRLADEGREKQMSHYALIAVGRIAAAKDTEDALRVVCLRRLRDALENGKPAKLTPPFAALGLGLVAHGGAAGPLDEEGLALPLRRRFADEKDGKTRAAYAVALGLVRDPRAVADLVAVLEDAGNDVRLRGYSALALGMIGADEGRRPVRAALLAQAEPELRVLAAMGAGLLGDSRAGEDLVAILRSKDESQYVLGSAALALGRIGDENAVDPLLAVARDSRKYGVLTRALAVVALGQIGDRSDVPTLARFAEELDYRAATPAMAELLTIL